MNKLVKYFAQKVLVSSMWHYALVLLIAVSAICFFYRDVFANGFDLLLGDDVDAHLNILIADSWNDFFCGNLPIRQTRIFYPFDHARGFTDLNLSLYILQKPLLALGVNYIYSAQIVYICLLLTGIITMFHLCWKLFKFSWITSVYCALLAFFNNSFWLKQLHTQFFFICLVPLFAICLFRYFQYLDQPQKSKSLLYGCSGCLVFALISYSNFYSAYFLAMWLIIFLPVILFLLKRQKKFNLSIVTSKISEFFVLSVWALILHIPFLYIYYPVMRSFKRSWMEVSGGLPVLTDVLNFGEKNFIWGDFYKSFFPAIHKNIYEQSYGLTPLTFTLCLAAFIAVITMNKKKKTVPAWVTAFLITFIIVNIMIIKISSHTSSLYPYTSLWYFAYQLLPGANAIRAMSRIYVLFMLPAALLLGWFIEKITNKVAPYYRGCLIAFAGSLVLLDNFNLTEPATLRYSDIKNFTDNVPAPPADCKVFFVIAADPVYGKTQALAGLQAWEIARKYNLYCINGYSGNFPTEIHPDKNHSQADIEKNIDSYIAKYKIENVYVYDVQKKIWSKFESTYLHCTVK